MNLLNLIQNFIIVSTPTPLPRCCLLTLVSDRRSSRRIHDCYTKSGKRPVGS